MVMMKDRAVLVEICLTSNDVILNVKGADHPLPDYLKAGVPVTLASDDEGVARIDLSSEYLPRCARLWPDLSGFEAADAQQPGVRFSSRRESVAKECPVCPGSRLRRGYAGYASAVGELRPAAQAQRPRARAVAPRGSIRRVRKSSLAPLETLHEADVHLSLAHVGEIFWFRFVSNFTACPMSN